MSTASHLYQKTHTYFAQTAAGIEELAVKEAQNLGASRLKAGFRGFHFSGGIDVLYRMNYQARLISRILAPLKAFDCSSTDTLYKQALQINWTKLFSLDQTFAVYGTVSNSKITHSKFAALKLKDAIADKFREHHNNKRPNVDTKHPDVRIVIHINNNKATLYLDTSGDSLHMRGYRELSVAAPMRETVAAAIIQMSGWDGKSALYDPMCGSGTLLAEALMYSCNIPAGYLRKKFGFEMMPDFDPVVWAKIKNNADAEIRELEPGIIRGSDIDPEAFKAASLNLQKLPGGEDLILKRADFNEIADLENRTIITNPPYGIRLKDRHDAGALIKQFGDFLKQKCSGSTAFVYFGERELIKKIGLKTAFKKPLQNGGLDGRLCRFDMY